MGIFTYETYQDVRQNLFRYSVPFLIATGLFCYLRILPPGEQKWVVSVLEYVSQTQPWKGLLGAGVGVAVLTVVAFLLTEVFQVHDHWYDKHLTKWRHYYAIDYILPRLVQPFGSHLNYRFHEEAELHTVEFQERLYYPFVGDRDLKIPKNKLVRFYEVVTLYWLTQVNEILLLVMSLLVAFYRFAGPEDVSYRTTLLTNCIVLAVAFVLNRYAARDSLSKVREATAEEIRAIHDDANLLADLRCRLISLCSDYKIPYNEPPKSSDNK